MERLSSWNHIEPGLSPGSSTSIAERLWKRYGRALNLDFPACKMGIPQEKVNEEASQARPPRSLVEEVAVS